MNSYRVLMAIAAMLLSLQSPAAALPDWQAPLLQDHPLVGQIYHPKDQRQITQEVLLSTLQDAKYVLVGEQHDNEDHHQLEQWLVQQLPIKSLVLEMLSEDQRPITAPTPHDSPAQLQAKLKWNDQGWPWALYGQVITTAVQKNITLLPGNISRQSITALYKGEQTLEHTLPIAATDWLLEQVFRGHCELMPKSQLQPMVDIQIARDQAMAKALTQASPPALLLAGGTHVDKRFAVPAHLNAAIQPITLLLVEVDPTKPAFNDYKIAAEQADFVWFTPKQSQEDKCAALEAKFKARHNKEQTKAPN